MDTDTTRTRVSAEPVGGSARERVADLWDDVVRRWLDGDRTLPPDLARWKASYSGQIDESSYPDPFVGDLRGESGQPALIVLGINPGVGYPELQAPDGTWAQRIANASYSRCLDRVPFGDDAWTALHGRDSAYWNRLMKFARRYTSQPSLAVPQVLNLELYPWHSPSVDGHMQPPADLLDTYVWQPIAELPHARDVFAFAKGWYSICTDLGWPLLHQYGGPGQPPVPGWTGKGWNLAVFAMPSGQRAVVSWQAGYAGPPGAERTEALRALLDQLG